MLSQGQASERHSQLTGVLHAPKTIYGLLQQLKRLICFSFQDCQDPQMSQALHFFTLIAISPG